MRPKTNEEIISPDALAMLQSTMRKLEIAQIAKDAIVQEIVEQYKLKSTDALDVSTGVITRKEII